MVKYRSVTFTMDPQTKDKLGSLSTQIERESGVHIGESLLVRSLLTDLLVRLKPQEIKKIVLEHKAHG